MLSNLGSEINLPYLYPGTEATPPSRYSLIAPPSLRPNNDAPAPSNPTPCCIIEGWA